MKKILSAILFSVTAFMAQAQGGDVSELQQTAKTFMRSGDYDNAVIVLKRGLSLDAKNLELQKDLALTYFLKRDFTRAKESAKTLADHPDADEVAYQIVGNVYKSLEEVKECEKMFKKALKKFPNSGPLHSEYGELLWAAKRFDAIDQWEKGIQVAPSFSGNYYNAAMYYYYAKDKVWTLIYGEIFVNMESRTERGAAMKELLLKAYKEKLFAEADIMKGEEKNKNEFAKAYLQTMGRQSSLANQGLSIETLTMIRSRFILDWFANHAQKFPFKLFDYQRQLLQSGLFEAYNQWLFGPVENLANYEQWTKTHAEDFEKFNKIIQNTIFKMPAGQYYR